MRKGYVLQSTKEALNFVELRQREVRRNPLGERMNNRLIERGRE